MRIDISFLPALAATFMLVFARVGTMVMLLPGLGELSVPVRVRLTVALVLAAVLVPLHRGAYALDLRSFGPVLAMRTVATAFRIGIQLSAPFVVFGLLFNLGLGVLSRLMPQMQVFFVGLPISILLGFLILLLVVGAMMGTFLGSVESVLRELAPHS